MNEHIHPEILQRIKEQEKQGGVDLNKLAIGTKIEAQTLSTLYKIEILPNGKAIVEGGRYFPEPKETYIGGSTWGGSMLKLGWLGLGMHIEIKKADTDGCMITTAVQSLKVIAPDNSWEYSL
jgi:hypothetical protein